MKFRAVMVVEVHGFASSWDRYEYLGEEKATIKEALEDLKAGKEKFKGKRVTPEGLGIKKWIIETIGD